MADNAPKKAPVGGGIRPPDYIRELALARVEDLMLQAYSPREIFAKLHDEGFTESEATAKEWRLAIQKRWALEDAEQRPARKDAWRRRIESQYQKLLEHAETTNSELARASYFAEATKLAKLALIMDGLTAPVKVEHSGAMMDPLALQPHERETRIAELLAKREAALAAAARAGGKVVH
ncbi:MAG TPA: hypothetical protein VMZ53_03755 [Kofleriaceae bacterium]|nr:hypothetical protein [Kofleriaceae bacterium]